MKFMIAGLGSIGRRHLRNLLRLGERDILLYRTFKSTLPEDELEGFPVERDLDQALAHQPDAVIVSNPTSMHMQVAIPSARAGCHLYLEKPVSHNFEGVKELLTAVQSGGGQVYVGYQFRLHPGLLHIRRLLCESAIGKPVSIRAHWGEYLPGWHPWEDFRRGYSARHDLGGGVILTLSHTLDYLRWLMGDIEAVWAFAAKNAELALDVEDTAEIAMRFQSGVLGSLHLDYIQQPPVHHLEIIGTSGTLRWDQSDGAVQLFEKSSKEWIVFSPPPDFNRDQLFVNQMSHFLEVIRGKLAPACTLEDGLAALKLAQACLASQNEAKLVRLSDMELLL